MKLRFKIFIDLCMTVALLLLMGYQIWGEEAHEWIGAGIGMLFLAHHLLNWNWYKNLFKGKYAPMRIFKLCINFLLLFFMLIQMYSGIAMSRHVFSFIPFQASMSVVRRLHILGAYWGFVLMSLHLGLHWNMFVSMAGKKKRLKGAAPFHVIFKVIGLLIAVYGLFVFIKRDFITYMLLQTEFVFLDYNEPVVLFYLDYLAIMGLWTFLAHYFAKLLKIRTSKKPKEEKK